MAGLTTYLSKRLFNMKESYIKNNGEKVKGRQIIWVIYQFFKVDPNSGVLFGIEDLLAVEMKIHKLDEFLAERDEVIVHMEKPPAPEFKQAIFINQIKECPKLKTECDNYYKASEGSEIRCFEYLYNSAVQVVERDRFESARAKVANKGRDSMPAPGDGKGKGKGKGTKTGADGQPWNMEDGKDVRAKQPCRFLAAGHCKLGNTCPWNHNMNPGKRVDSAAAPSSKGPHDPNHPGYRATVCRTSASM
eukprot:5299674-Heterocapsa_arctica.AAC.1